ncbi:MAG: hypothetical protein QXG63_04705 [Nitrososphaerales archaeon]
MRLKVKEETSGKHDVWGSEVSMEAWSLEKIVEVAGRYVKRKHLVECGGEKLSDLSDLRGKVVRKEVVK